MKKILSVVFGVLLISSVHAESLNQNSLQGDWLITHFQGSPDDSGDMWQFEGNKFYQNLGGRRVSPDGFTTAPGVIDLGYAKIQVSSFNGQAMEATMAGFKYKLVKQ